MILAAVSEFLKTHPVRVFNSQSAFSFVAFLVCLCLFPAATFTFAAQNSENVFVIEGSVTDATGNFIAGAAVSVDSDTASGKALVKTDAKGIFELKLVKADSYTLRIAKEGFSSRTLNISTEGAVRKKVDVKLEAAPGKMVPDMQLSDSPNFTVAGVTDWSNVGLHGSDVNVKTSEALTKEAAALKPAKSDTGQPKNEAEAHRLFGDAKEKSGDPVAAEREYEMAVKLDPSEENYFTWGAELLLHRAGVAAVQVLTKGAAEHPKSQRMVEALGAAFYANGQFAESAQQMCRAADLFPANAEPYLFLGRIEQAAGDVFPCSEAKLRQFANEQPRNARANFYYGLLLFKKARQSQRDADFQQAEEFFQKALTIDSAYGEVYVQLGIMYNARGKNAAALREFNKAVAAAPTLTAAHYQLSLAYRRDGRPAKANEEMKQYEELRRSEEAALEKERKEMKQFVTTLKQSASQ